jgi:hypothetical protein
MALKQIWQQRFPYIALIIFLQLLYFPLNQKASVGIRLDLPIIDGVMPLVGEFVVIYVAGIVFFCFGPFIMALCTHPSNRDVDRLFVLDDDSGLCL